MRFSRGVAAMLKIMLKNVNGHMHVSYIAAIDQKQITPQIETELKRYGLMLSMYMTDKIVNNDHVLAILDLDPKKSTYLQTLHTVVFSTPEYFIYQGLSEHLLSSCFKDIDSYTLSTIPLEDSKIVTQLIPMDDVLKKRINNIINKESLVPGLTNTEPTLSFLPSQSAKKVLPQLKLAAVNNKLGETDSKDRTPFLLGNASFQKMHLSTSDYFIPFVVDLASTKVRDLLIELNKCAPKYKQLLAQARALHDRKDAKVYEEKLDRVDNLWNTFQINITSNLLSVLQKKTHNNLNNSNLPPDKIFSNLISEVNDQLEKAHLNTVTESVLIHGIKNNFIHSFELATLDIWMQLNKLENEVTKTERLAALDTFLEDFEASINFKSDNAMGLRRREAFLQNPKITARYEDNRGAFIAFFPDYQSLNLDRTEKNLNKVREEIPPPIQTYRAEYRAAVLEKFKELNNTVTPDPKRPVNFPYFTFINGTFTWDNCITNAHNPAVSRKIEQEVAAKIEKFYTYARNELADCKQLEEKCNNYKTAADNAVAALATILDSVTYFNKRLVLVTAKYNKCKEDAENLRSFFSSIGNLTTKSAAPSETALQEMERRLCAYKMKVEGIKSAIDKIGKVKDIPSLRREEQAVDAELDNKCEINFRNQFTLAVNKVTEFQREMLLKEFLSQLKTAAQNVKHWNSNTTKFFCIGGSRATGSNLKVPQVIAETINAFNVDIFSLNLAQTKALYRQVHNSATESAARRDKRFFQTQKNATQQWNQLILTIEPNNFMACNADEAFARNQKLAVDLAVVMNTQSKRELKAEGMASVTRQDEPSVSSIGHRPSV
jgi:hypothetical protein